MTPVITTIIMAAAALALPASSALASAAAAAANNADHVHAGAGTTKLWRCTDGSGHIGYSQQACASAQGVEGDSQPMHIKDERTRSQQRESMDHQLRDMKLARQMRAERLHQERVASQDRAISLSGKGKPHVIKSTPNDHRPVPISDSTRPLKVKAPKGTPKSKKRTAPDTPATSQLGAGF